MERDVEVPRDELPDGPDLTEFNELRDGGSANADEESRGKRAQREPKVQSSVNVVRNDEEDTIPGLKAQLETIMNSLAVLSAEKSRMEASFQIEKKQIRSEREEHERVIKNLKEKLKRIQGHAMSEVEHLKYKLIMVRHEKEKDQTEYSALVKQLQKKLQGEQKQREHLECQIKELRNSLPSKSQNRVLEAELDVVKNKLKQAESVANEAPVELLKLQVEMSALKKRHKLEIHESRLKEQKTIAAAEQETRSLAASHESIVAGLEARLTELSDIVGSYDNLRQQDQRTIYKLKDQLFALQNNNNKPEADQTPQQIANRIKGLYFKLVDMDKAAASASSSSSSSSLLASSSNVKDLLDSLNVCDNSENISYKEKYETAVKDFEEWRERYAPRGGEPRGSKQNSVDQRGMEVEVAEKEVEEVKVKVKGEGEEEDEEDDDDEEKEEVEEEESQSSKAKARVKSLEDKLRTLMGEMSEMDKDFKARMEMERKQLQEQCTKTEQLLLQKDIEHSNKTANLEQQLLKQRERSLTIVQEKEKEIRMLKSSFDALLPKRNALDTANQRFNLPSRHLKTEVTDLISGLLAGDHNPPMIHYSQELARKEVQVSNLRKQSVQMEMALRELERNAFRTAEKHDEESKRLTAQITRLEASKSREGANLEYLKNVFINYLTSDDAAGKRHMLNAISTVLQFTSEEVDKISSKLRR